MRIFALNLWSCFTIVVVDVAIVEIRTTEYIYRQPIITDRDNVGYCRCLSEIVIL